MAISPFAGAFLLARAHNKRELLALNRTRNPLAQALARAYNKKELLALNKTKKSLMLSRIFS
jgi:hypothetical protein